MMCAKMLLVCGEKVQTLKTVKRNQKGTVENAKINHFFVIITHKTSFLYSNNTERNQPSDSIDF
jgi:hypothetical protein